MACARPPLYHEETCLGDLAPEPLNLERKLLELH